MKFISLAISKVYFKFASIIFQKQSWDNLDYDLEEFFKVTRPSYKIVNCRIEVLKLFNVKVNPKFCLFKKSFSLLTVENCGGLLKQ